MQAVSPKQRKENKEAAELERRSLINFLKDEYPGPPGTEMVVIHLWDDYYRINYWGKKDKDNIITDSIFMRVAPTKEGWKVLRADSN
jgi:hypothetical protein